MTSVNWGALAQMMTACSAIAALFLAPRLAGRNEQRKLMAATQQSWLDALRSDVAELIAVWMQVVAIRERIKDVEALRADERERVYRTDHLNHRVRLCLDLSDTAQNELYKAISGYLNAKSFTELSDRRLAVGTAMETLAATVAQRVKSGK
ncbi:hypothetical protein ABC969_00015 [Sphingomonas qilianensis]|uniref:Uncharacterized protein n=2 Tax=Sphingomonas qilianensis TaxID=1736690 RepID=A0ABU9XLW8_9SPHN